MNECSISFTFIPSFAAQYFISSKDLNPFYVVAATPTTTLFRCVHGVNFFLGKITTIPAYHRVHRGQSKFILCPGDGRKEKPSFFLNGIALIMFMIGSFSYSFITT